jgi:hypothetical protein
MNKSRRDAVKLVIGGLAAAPLLNLVSLSSARASDLPHVDPATDPTAQALKYHTNSTEADRAGAARPGLPADQQHCANCQFSQADAAGASAEWLGCQLFPGKLVSANGWCQSWTLKAG